MEADEIRKNPGLGPALKTLRTRTRLRQEEVADIVGKRRGQPMTTNWYAKLENRATAYPSESDLTHILAAVGSDRSELMAMLALAPRPAQAMPDEATELAGTWSTPIAGPGLRMRRQRSAFSAPLSSAQSLYEDSTPPGLRSLMNGHSQAFAGEEKSLASTSPQSKIESSRLDSDIELLGIYQQLKPRAQAVLRA